MSQAHFEPCSRDHPLLAALVLTVLAELLRFGLDQYGQEIPGATQLFYGICLLLVIVFLPNGIWPALRRRLGLAGGG